MGHKRGAIKKSCYTALIEVSELAPLEVGQNVLSPEQSKIKTKPVKNDYVQLKKIMKGY